MKAFLVWAFAFALVGSLIAGGGGDFLTLGNAISASSEHPLVGSWSGKLFLFTFAADGTATATDKDGLNYHGAWQPAGDNTATYDLQTLLPGGGGQGFTGPALVDEKDELLITGGDHLVRIVAPDAADYDFSTPAPS